MAQTFLFHNQSWNTHYNPDVAMRWRLVEFLGKLGVQHKYSRNYLANKDFEFWVRESGCTGV